MDNQHLPDQPENLWSVYDPPKNITDSTGFLTDKPEAIFGLVILILGLCLGNCFVFGGMNLGFAISLLGCTAAAVAYLRRSGRKGSRYSRALLVLCAFIILGLARTDDQFVKFIMGSFLFMGINLGLCGMAGRNLWNPASVHSLLDPFRCFFGLGFGRMGRAFRGIREAVREGGETVKKGSAVLMGAVIAIPILVIMIPLLIRSDAAFEGLLDLLPEFNFFELLATVIFGGTAACILYTRTVALVHDDPVLPREPREQKGLHPLTMNTALLAVCALYVVYLLSQLAYFVGGFSGILPKGYSLAEYARRGFFEMAWLCVINLSVMILGISLTRKQEGKAPLTTRIACLFIGLVTLFFVFAAGAKMLLYIGTYGMTRLRILTMVIMVFWGLTTATVSVWLFLPKLPYMKVVLITALVMGGIVLWADVNTVVARYNVEAYLSGQLATVDVDHLSGLGSGAVPYLDRLAREAKDPFIREYAENVLRNWWIGNADLRAWNFTDWIARDILEQWPWSGDSVPLS